VEETTVARTDEKLVEKTIRKAVEGWIKRTRNLRFFFFLNKLDSKAL
jgi:hypothetical protein